MEMSTNVNARYPDSSYDVKVDIFFQRQYQKKSCMYSLIYCHEHILTLIQPGKGRFTLAYMSHDYLHGSHAGLPGWIRVNFVNFLVVVVHCKT